MKPDHEKYLVSFDTDRIKEYIYATNSLREIRGASAILVELEDARLQQLESGQLFKLSDEGVVFAAGGSGGFLTDDANTAQHMAEWLESEFRQKTTCGSVTTVIVPPDGEKSDGWFKNRMASARAKMRRAKALKAELTSLPLEPYVRPCAACGMLAAEFRDDPEGELICNACMKKRQKGRQERGYKQKFEKHLSNVAADKSAIWKNTGLAPDLNALAELDSSKSIGFITMDGNNMGQLLDEIESKDDYFNYSKKLKDTVEKLIFEALIAITKPRDGNWPFEIVLIGGDDVMLFVTAQYAMPVALHIVQRFEQHSDEILQAAGFDPHKHERLSMSASVVYAHGTFPIPALVDIGDSLLKRAKRCADDWRNQFTKKERFGKAYSMIDFQVISGSMAQLDEDDSPVRYERPFSLERMRMLWDFVEKAKAAKIPSSPLQRVYDFCMNGNRNEGTMATLQMIGRLRESSQRQLLRKLFHDFTGPEIKEKHADREAHTFWPWTSIDANGHLRTVYIDLVELLKFAENKTRGEPQS